VGWRQERVSAYVRLLLRELSVGSHYDHADESFLADCVRAARLYDIGMLGIPESIRIKPVLLTDAERFRVQKHVELGETILNHIALRHSETSYFHLAAQLARWHHECFDGSGYPDKLRGEEIPMAARVVKVADVFDALTSARPYKPRYDPFKARDVVLAGRGVEFDPLVVDAMTRVFEEFLEISQEPEIECPAAPTNPQSNQQLCGESEERV
jgi:putative two-component system response regulator